MKPSFSAMIFLTALACGTHGARVKRRSDRAKLEVNTTEANVDEDLFPCSKSEHQPLLEACATTYCGTWSGGETDWPYEKCQACFDRWCARGGGCGSAWCDCPGKLRQQCQDTKVVWIKSCLITYKIIEGGSHAKYGSYEKVTQETGSMYSKSTAEQTQKSLSTKIQGAYAGAQGFVKAKLSAAFSEATQSAVSESGYARRTEEKYFKYDSAQYLYQGEVTVKFNTGLQVVSKGQIYQYITAQKPGCETQYF